jgi:hypothetical protein
MVEKGNKFRDRPFEINVVFPERVIGIDEQRLSSVLVRHVLIITAPAGLRAFDKLVLT